MTRHAFLAALTAAPPPTQFHTARGYVWAMRNVVRALRGMQGVGLASHDMADLLARHGDDVLRQASRPRGFAR